MKQRRPIRRAAPSADGQSALPFELLPGNPQAPPRPRPMPEWLQLLSISAQSASDAASVAPDGLNDEELAAAAPLLLEILRAVEKMSR